MNSTAAEEALAARLSESELEEIVFSWGTWARQQQWPPPGDWTTWLLMGGRGSGKTRAGAEWVRGLADRGVTPIALVGETMTEALAVMVRGQSGVLSTYPPGRRPKLRGTELHWNNGAVAQVMSASDPDRFRGPQFAAAWCDEIAKWPSGEAAWDMLQFALRLGERPRQVATTTPKATRLLKRLLADEEVVITRMQTAENSENLANGFLEAVVARYRGTVLGRQELDGELIEDRPDALWTRAVFQETTAKADGRTVVAVDPPVTGGAKSDACGIIVAGRLGAQGAVVLADQTIGRATPLTWARRAVTAYRAHQADCIVAEVNQGGDLVQSIIAQVDSSVPVRAVRANRGKWLRAEPVAALYARGLVSHRPGLSALEDEMCAFGADGMADGHSPDRVDALVWALTELMLGPEDVTPKVRGI